jgi:tetratricopeptide (TPR) repeat protein
MNCHINKVVGYGGYKAHDIHERHVKPKFEEAHRNVYDFLNPDALRVKINDLTFRLTVSKRPIFYVKRGELYLLGGDVKSAYADFSAALELSNRTDPMAHFYMGVINTSRGNHRSAIQDYTDAIKNETNRSVMTDSEQKYDDVVNKVEHVRRVVKQTNDSVRVNLTNLFNVKVSRLFFFSLMYLYILICIYIYS